MDVTIHLKREYECERNQGYDKEGFGERKGKAKMIQLIIISRNKNNRKSILYIAWKTLIFKGFI